MTLCTCCSHIWRDRGNGRREPGRRQAVARWNHRGGNTSRLCLECLNGWFDNADDDPDLEPASWAWLPGAHPQQPTPTTADITAWARDPRNHQVLADVLRREVRIDPTWLREFLRRDERVHRVALT